MNFEFELTIVRLWWRQFWDGFIKKYLCKLEKFVLTFIKHESIIENFFKILETILKRHCEHTSVKSQRNFSSLNFVIIINTCLEINNLWQKFLRSCMNTHLVSFKFLKYFYYTHRFKQRLKKKRKGHRKRIKIRGLIL